MREAFDLLKKAYWKKQGSDDPLTFTDFKKAVEYHQSLQPVVDVRLIASRAFSAGRSYQQGEHSEYHGGREHDYPNFTDWFDKQELPHLQQAAPESDAVDFFKWCRENCNSSRIKDGVCEIYNYEAEEWNSIDQVYTEYKQSKTNSDEKQDS